MNNSNRYAIVACAVLAAMIFQTSFLTPDSQAMASYQSRLNFSSEIQTLESFGASLTALEKTCGDLQKKAAITSQELDSTRSTAVAVKSRVAQAQQAFRSVVDELRAAGKLDNPESALPPITNVKSRRLIQRNGGAKRILETLASQTGSLSQEIDSLLTPLNSRVRAGADGRDERDLSARRSSVIRSGSRISRIPQMHGAIRHRHSQSYGSQHRHGALHRRASRSEPEEAHCPGGSEYTPR